MKTVLETLKALNAKVGDTLTDGTRTWILKKYEHPPKDAPTDFYMREILEVGGKSVTGRAITSSLMHYIVIPGLRRPPRIVRLYRYVYQSATANVLEVPQPPRVTEHYYPSDVTGSVPAELQGAMWFTRLDQCHKDVEFDCGC